MFKVITNACKRRCTHTQKRFLFFAPVEAQFLQDKCFPQGETACRQGWKVIIKHTHTHTLVFFTHKTHNVQTPRRCQLTVQRVKRLNGRVKLRETLVHSVRLDSTILRCTGEEDRTHTHTRTQTDASLHLCEAALFWTSQCKQDVTYFDHDAILHHKILTLCRCLLNEMGSVMIFKSHTLREGRSLFSR